MLYWRKQAGAICLQRVIKPIEVIVKKASYLNFGVRFHAKPLWDGSVQARQTVRGRTTMTIEPDKPVLFGGFRKDALCTERLLGRLRQIMHEVRQQTVLWRVLTILSTKD